MELSWFLIEFWETKHASAMKFNWNGFDGAFDNIFCQSPSSVLRGEWRGFEIELWVFIADVTVKMALYWSHYFVKVNKAND
jgi:hypothetical protein